MSTELHEVPLYISFSLPIDELAKQSMKELIATRQVHRSCFGTGVDKFTIIRFPYENQNDEYGVRIGAVLGGSAAERMGLLVGDLITHVAGRLIKQHTDMMTELTKHKVGDLIRVEWVRDGKIRAENVTTEECSKNPTQTRKIEFF